MHMFFNTGYTLINIRKIVKNVQITDAVIVVVVVVVVTFHIYCVCVCGPVILYIHFQRLNVLGLSRSEKYLSCVSVYLSFRLCITIGCKYRTNFIETVQKEYLICLFVCV